MKITITALVAAMLVGCAAQQPQREFWHKADGSFDTAQVAKDQAECQHEATRAQASMDWRYINTTMAAEKIRLSCMQARGYVRGG